MKVKFLDSDYEDLHNGIKTMNFHNNLIKAFRKKIRAIESAASLNDLYNLSSLHLEKLE